MRWKPKLKWSLVTIFFSFYLTLFFYLSGFEQFIDHLMNDSVNMPFCESLFSENYETHQRTVMETELLPQISRAPVLEEVNKAESKPIEHNVVLQDHCMLRSEHVRKYDSERMNVEGVHLTGIVKNGGSDDVRIRIYIETIAQDRLMIDFTANPGVTTLMELGRSYFVRKGGSWLDESIQNLADACVDTVCYRLVMTSPSEIRVSTDLKLNGNIQVYL